MPLPDDHRPGGCLTGVDIGGTKLEAVVLGPEGDVRARARTPTPAGDYAATVAEVARLVGEVEAKAAGGSTTVGIGMPGSLSPATGLIRNANSTVLNDRPLDRDLAAALGRPVRLENDANCFALAEALAGAGMGAQSVFGVILGTGVGGGLVLDGKLLAGRNAIAGEWGHNPLPAPTTDELPGPACYCGRTGCIEVWCSGPGLAADHVRLTAEKRTPAEILAAAGRGNAGAQATLDRHTDRLARALAAVVNIVDPDVVVLGGGVSNLAHLYDRLPAEMAPHVFSDCVETMIVQNRLGDSAGVIGAAWLAREVPNDRDA